MTELQLILDALLLGGVFALLSLGLNLIFGVTRIVVFAYGEFLMLAMYAGYFFWARTGLEPYLALPVVLAVSAAGGFVLYQILFRRLVQINHLSQILATLGLAAMLQNVALFLWTADVRSVRSAFSAYPISLGGIHISTPRLIACVVGLLVSFAILVYLRRSHDGLAMRAVAQDRMAAELAGIPLDRVYRLTLVLSLGLIGLSATFMLPVFFVYPTVGLDFALLAFVIVVLGGMGSLVGGIVAGFIVALVQGLAAYYLGIQWQSVIYFSLFILVLLIRPAGLAGVRGTEELGS